MSVVSSHVSLLTSSLLLSMLMADTVPSLCNIVGCNHLWQYWKIELLMLIISYELPQSEICTRRHDQVITVLQMFSNHLNFWYRMIQWSRKWTKIQIISQVRLFLNGLEADLWSCFCDTWIILTMAFMQFLKT